MHTFRTIEEFVLLLQERHDRHHDLCMSLRKKVDAVSHGGSADAYANVIEIVRTSNLGIVIPAEDIESETGCEYCDRGMSVTTLWGGRKHAIGTESCGLKVVDCTRS